MKLTITGADDKVDIKQLSQLSREYNFVEWGLLYSKKHVGTNRYPSLQWYYDFVFEAMSNHNMRFAIHLCGSIAREVMDGNHRVAATAPANCANRIQINGYVPGRLDNLKRSAEFCTLILQCRKMEDLEATAHEACIMRADVLFDPSGGRGKEITQFPEALHGANLGFAGGINPDNIDNILKSVPSNFGIWIDMESGVRTNDEFDLNKVLSILEKVKKFNERNQDNIFGL